MASAAEQLASNLNFSTFAKAEDLKKRLWFTLGALLVYRLGTYIPLPGLNPEAFAQAFQGQSGGILGLFNMFSGGAVERMAIFALGIMPYISASIIVQLMTSVVPSLEQLKKEGEQGRKIINQYTRYGTVLLGTLQAYGIAVGLESGNGLVVDPGWFFRISTVISLLGGTMFLMWLGEQITSRGIGNGISLIIFAGIVAASAERRLPARSNSAAPARCRRRSFSPIIVMVVGVIALIVFVERAQRRLLIQYPKRQVGNRMFQGDTSHLPLKLNTSGVIPAIFASSLLLLPATLAGFANTATLPSWATAIVAALGHGQPLYMLLYGGDDRLLRLLLHGHRLQSEGHGRQSEEAWRLHPRHSSGRAHRRIHRLRPDPHHGHRRDLSDVRLHPAGSPDRADRRAVLPWWYVAFDCCQRDP